MSFFNRLSNLWTGFMRMWISDVEKKHPQIAYENAINGMVVKYAKLKSATAAIIRRRDEVTERLEAEGKELKQVGADLNTAVDSSQDDLALILIQKKNAIASSLTELNRDLAQSRADADDAKASLMAVKEEINKLKTEKDRMLAKMSSAEARLKVQNQIDGLSVDAEVQALDNVREHIRNTIAEADLNKEMGSADLDNRLRSLRQQTGDVTAKAELDALKKSRAQGQQATEPNKSM